VPSSRRRARTTLSTPRRLRWVAYDRFEQQLLAGPHPPRPVRFATRARRPHRPAAGAIREVIPRLEAEGLLRTVPQRGLQVATVDVRLVRNAFQLRLTLEREAAMQFATAVTDERLDAIEVAHRDIVKRAQRGVTPALLAAAQAVDWGLHDTMIDALGNEIISAIYRVNSLRIRLIRLDRVTLDAEALVPAMDEHLAVIAALRTRDPLQAAAALEAHLTHARNRALGL
jgi:DNA-binding GntR family transcriptional regulator